MALSFAQTAEILSAKQQRYRRAKDTTKLVLEPCMSLVNELTALNLSFERYKQPWHLQELRSVLEVVQEDLRFQPMPAYWGLRKFADLGEVLTEEDAGKVVEDVQDLWKDVAVTVPALLKLKEGLVAGQTFLSFRYLRGFIAQGCFALTKAETKGKTPDLVKLTKNALEDAERFIGPVESTPSIVTDNEGALLTAITAKVTEIKEAGKRFDLGVKQIAGDAGPDATLVDIWGKYADALDTDSAKKAFFEAVRYLASEVRTREEGLYGMVLDLSKVLDEMKLIKDD